MVYQVRTKCGTVFRRLKRRLLRAPQDSTRYRMMPAYVRGVMYTKDVLKDQSYDIGAFTYGTPRVFGQAPGRKLKIGKFCSIAPDVTIGIGGEHRMDRVSTYPFVDFPRDWPEADFLPIEEVWVCTNGDVIIGNDVWIGWGATILSGVTIGDGAVIGARAVVARDVEPYTVVVGNPAHLVRKRFDDETIRQLLEIRWWDWPIDKIRANMTIILGTDMARLLAKAHELHFNSSPESERCQ